MKSKRCRVEWLCFVAFCSLFLKQVTSEKQKIELFIFSEPPTAIQNYWTGQDAGVGMGRVAVVDGNHRPQYRMP